MVIKDSTRYQRLGVYALLSWLIMAPLLRSGFVFALDMAPTPVWRLPGEVTSSYAFYALMHVLNFVVPADILQKVLLFGIFLTAGLGMHALVQKLGRPRQADFSQALGTYFAGIFYVINPYTYSRFMSGQFAVLMGYALIPWFAVFLVGFLRKPDLSGAFKVGAMSALIGVVSIHSLGLIFLLATIAFCITGWKSRKDVSMLRTLGLLTTLWGAVFVVLSSYWLLPFVMGHSTTAGAISGFGPGDQRAFMTLGGSAAGRLANVGRLEGFWVEGQGLYRLPQSIGPVWWLLMVAVICLVAFGVVAYWRKGRHYETALFVSCTVIAAILAAGILTHWLSIHIPLFAGYREPHKFAGLVALGYALFAGAGVETALNWCHNRAKRLVPSLAAVMLIIPFVFTPSMILGGGKQLSARHYPASWYIVNSRLDADKQQFKVLFLPWHQYMHFGFAATIMANPAENFFDKPTLVNNDPEFGHSSPNKTNPIVSLISRDILPGASKNTNLGARLKGLHVKYVILAEESDSDNYRYLERQRDLKLVYSDASIKLYENVAMSGQGQ